jgi:hypothetical protein
MPHPLHGHLEGSLFDIVGAAQLHLRQCQADLVQANLSDNVRTA